MTGHIVNSIVHNTSVEEGHGSAPGVVMAGEGAIAAAVRADEKGD
jgi:hypothetical protein